MNGTRWRAEVGARIATAIDHTRKSQKAIADDVGVTQATVSRWCRGEVMPEWQALVTLAEVLGVSALWLLQPLDNRAPSPEPAMDWIASDPALSTEQRAALTAVYRTFTDASAQAKPSGGRRRSSKA